MKHLQTIDKKAIASNLFQGYGDYNKETDRYSILDLTARKDEHCAQLERTLRTIGKIAAKPARKKAVSTI